MEPADHPEGSKFNRQNRVSFHPARTDAAPGVYDRSLSLVERIDPLFDPPLG